MKFAATYIAVLTIVILGSSLVPGQASAADWGKGTFEGRVKGAFGPRPASKVVLVAKGSKVRVKNIGLQLRCSDDKYGLPSRFTLTIHSPTVRVKHGAAGGGAILKFRVKETYRGQKVPIRVEIFLGLRDRKIEGTLDADVSGSLPICSDSGIFTARK